MASTRPFKLTGHGSTALWGVTPAIDLIQTAEGALNKGKLAISPDGPLNILICSAGDCRHVIKTLAKERGRSSTQQINFYVLNSSVEGTARDLLLLSIIMESTETLGFAAKAEMFLELLGNLKLREQTKHFLQRKCEDLTSMITNDKTTLSGQEVFDLSHLRYKDRDSLETTFKLWMTEDPKLDLVKCWDARIRRDLEGRYDTRVGAFDWDFAMNLCEIGAAMITAPAYYRWRETGIAFENRDTTAYAHPNKTLLSGLSISQKDTSRELWGFWGDMQTSPYVAFGLGEDALKYRKQCNNIDTVSSAEISHNVLEDYCRMIATGCIQKDDILKMGVVITELAEGDEPDGGGDAAQNMSDSWQSNYKVIFLPPAEYSVISDREKYQHLFDVVYVGGHSLLDSISGLTRTLRPNACLIFESPKYLIGLPKTRCADYYRVLKEKFGPNGYDVTLEYKEKQDDLFCFLRSHRS